MKTALFLLALLAAAVAPAAQERVQLSGWALPEGAVVVSVGGMAAEQAWALTDSTGVVAFTERSVYWDSTEVTVDAVREGALQQATSRYLTSRNDRVELVEGDTVRASVERSPLEGHAIVFERGADGWRRHLAEGTPTAAQQAFLDGLLLPDELVDPEYPDEPVAVGETWTVGADVLGRVYANLAPDVPQRLTLRLDSTGVFDGHPAAFVAFELDMTTQLETARTQTLRRGYVVRLLDLFVNVVYEAESRTRLEGTGVWAEGGAYTAEADGRARTSFRLSIDLPEDVP